MRALNRRVFPIVLLVALVIGGAMPAFAQEELGGSPSTADGNATEQAQASGKESRVKAKLVVDCKSKKSKRSDNKKVRKFCDRKRDGGKRGRDAVSAEGSNQQTFNCGTISFSVADIGQGAAQFSFWGESRLGSVLGGGWEIPWKNHNTGASRAPNGTIEPSLVGNPAFFLDSVTDETGRGRVVASLTGFVTTQSAFCLILPPVRAEETVLR